MKHVKRQEVPAYAAPGHFDVSTMRIQGKDETGITKFWMGKSYFLPGGGADWGYEDSPTEKVYYVLDGQLTVSSKDEKFVLNPGDSLFIAPFEGRTIKNETNECCTILVAISYE